MEAVLLERCCCRAFSLRGAGRVHDLGGSGVTSQTDVLPARDRERFALGDLTVALWTFALAVSTVLTSTTRRADRTLPRVAVGSAVPTTLSSAGRNPRSGGVAAGTSRRGQTKRKLCTASTCLQKPKQLTLKATHVQASAVVTCTA